MGALCPSPRRCVALDGVAGRGTLAELRNGKSWQVLQQQPSSTAAAAEGFRPFAAWLLLRRSGLSDRGGESGRSGRGDHLCSN